MATESLELRVRRFSQDNNITVEGKKDNPEFYIVRRGRVSVFSETNVAHGNDVIQLEEGDYFGLISSFTKHARTETVDAATDTELIVVREDQFEAFAAKHPGLVMKMINKLSKDLRLYDGEISKRTHGETEEDESNHLERLFDIGSYYFAKKNYHQAIYAFTRYLQYNDSGEHAEDAREKIQQMSSAAQNAMNSQNPEGAMSRDYRPDTFLFCEHEPGEEAFVIQEGQVKIVKIEGGKEVQLATIGPPELTGEMALIENKPRSASAIADGEVKVLAINKSNFDVMIGTQTYMTKRLFQTLCERIWVAYRQLANLLIENLTGRLWDRVLIEIEKTGASVAKGSTFACKFGPLDLLNMIGVNQDDGRAAVRQMMEDRKTIELRDNKLFVLDSEGVQKQASYFRNMQERERKIRERNLDD